MGRHAAVDTSIIISNRNGRDYLVECLASALDYSPGRLEVILVDNASTDGSVEAAVALFGDDHRLRVIYSDHDIGRAAAYNLGLRQARGFYLVLLDADTRVAPDWLKHLLYPLKSGNVIGAVQAKLLSYDNPDELDSAGGQTDIVGTPLERGRGRGDAAEADRGQYDREEAEEIFWASSAAMAVRSDVLVRTGYFDPEFNGYLEDLDLCWRIRLAGYRVVLAPRAVVYHRRRASPGPDGSPDALSGSDETAFHLNKNQLACVVKNYRLPTLIMVSPLAAAVYLARAMRGFSQGGSVRACAPLRAVWWAIRNRAYLRLERRTIRRKVRKITDREVMRAMMTPGVSLTPRVRYTERASSADSTGG